MESIENLDSDYLKSYLPGQVINVDVLEIIKPSQIITNCVYGFTGRLSILDIAWCMPEAEDQFKDIKIGDRISCVIVDVDFITKQIKLSKKYLEKQKSTIIKWTRIDRGDELIGNIIEEYLEFDLLKTTDGHYGLLTKSYNSKNRKNQKVTVYSKLDDSELLMFIPAGEELEEPEVDSIITKQERFNNLENDFATFSNFKKSVLGQYATDDELEIIQNGFLLDSEIFSNEILTKSTLYIQFEHNRPAYEITLKENAIPYFFENGTYSDENEKKVLEKLANVTYWFRVNKQRKNNSDKEVINFTLFTEDININGEVITSADQKETLFIIKNFSFGHGNEIATKTKKYAIQNGAFLFLNPLKILPPRKSLPIGINQNYILQHALLKHECFEVKNRLKKNTGEILRQEGRALQIFDKYLEYQADIIANEFSEEVTIEHFTKIPDETGGVSIKVSADVGKILQIEETAMLNVRLLQNSYKTNVDHELTKVTEGFLTYKDDYCKISFGININLNLLKDGFIVDKKVSIRQIKILRNLIKDFLQKKINIDHIESLLTRPEKIKIPINARIDFINPDLIRTAKDNPHNNQIKAVRKAVGNQNVFLIQGPPGTGKTTVITEIIQQLTSKGKKILVAGQNHVAVDNVLEKISKLHHLNLLRVGNPDRVDRELVRYNIDNLIDDYKSDFYTFQKNQVILSKEYLSLRLAKLSHEHIYKKYTDLVNSISQSYEKLENVYREKHFVLREGLESMTDSEIEDTIETLQQWIISIKDEYEILLKPVIYNSVDVVFATCIGIRTDKVFEDASFKFDTVIIDEAGKANIAETLAAIELGEKIILVGDQKQLPPYVDSSQIDIKNPSSFNRTSVGANYLESEINHALKTSFFEFIIDKINAGSFPKENLVMLNYQHRMHPNIGKFVSKSFYNNEVLMGERTYLNKLNLPAPLDHEVIFFDTSNSDNPYEQKDNISFRNDTEAETISEIILPRIFENNIASSDIAIITPYKSQVNNIQKYINRSSLTTRKNIDIASLDSFQGKEYDIIIFSFTRSSLNQKVGFLDNAQRLNVAFSRAKKKLILVGNTKTLVSPKSHYDIIFDYTELFKNLVRLSNVLKVTDYKNNYNSKNKVKKLYIDNSKSWPANNHLLKIKVPIVGTIFKIIDTGYLVAIEEEKFLGILPKKVTGTKEYAIGDTLKIKITYLDKVNYKIMLTI